MATDSTEISTPKIEGLQLLFYMFTNNGDLSFSKLPVIFAYLVKSIIMIPFRLWEKIVLKERINSTTIDESPVFVIGHYRSGTTFLHKVMSSDKRWGRITTFDFLFPYCPQSMIKLIKGLLQSIINVFRIKHLHFHDYHLNLDDPIEEDMLTISSLTRSSAFWSEIFPKNANKFYDEQIFFRSDSEKEAWKEDYLYCLKKVVRRNKGKRLMLKNPPNTGRVKAILEIFPDAKFIFIYRNPYQVYYSTLSLWKRTLEKFYTLQKITDSDRDSIIFSHYRKLMGQYLLDRDLIPKSNITEIRYENFEKDPFGEIDRTYSELGLPDFNHASISINKQLKKEKKYTKYSYNYDIETQDKIYQNWGKFIDLWQFKRLA